MQLTSDESQQIDRRLTPEGIQELHDGLPAVLAALDQLHGTFRREALLILSTKDPAIIKAAIERTFGEVTRADTALRASVPGWGP